jgi:hypothetical protein
MQRLGFPLFEKKTPSEKRGEQTRGEEVYQRRREEGGHRKERRNNPILKVINHVN